MEAALLPTRQVLAFPQFPTTPFVVNFQFAGFG
jgi:hypothetical protein